MNEVSDLTGWLTTKEAATILECTQNNIIQMVHRSKFPHCVKISGVIMIPVEDVSVAKEIKDKRKERVNNPQKFKFPERPEIKLQ